MSDNERSVDHESRGNYSDETVREFTEAMKMELQVRIMERENDRAHINNHKDIAITSLNHQADYLKHRPKQQRMTMAVVGFLLILMIVVLGWFYINNGEDYVLKILGGVFYLGSVYFSYRFGLKRADSNQIQEFD